MIINQILTIYKMPNQQPPYINKALAHVLEHTETIIISWKEYWLGK